MMKAVQAISRYAARDIFKESGLGDSEFRILEALHHKGPLPVNTLGPKVNLTPGSISMAVDRLHKRGLVTRRESPEDRRVRIVAMTQTGQDAIAPLFKKHVVLIKEVFSELGSGELQQFEALLKRIGMRAQRLEELKLSLGRGSLE
jgi:MarR family 2-MHQ and catechol resistance regulon transcriptional repressor